jgi:hypothetical protein
LEPILAVLVVTVASNPAGKLSAVTIHEADTASVDTTRTYDRIGCATMRNMADEVRSSGSEDDDYAAGGSYLIFLYDEQVAGNRVLCGGPNVTW